MKIRMELVSTFTDENLLPKRETAHGGWLRLKGCCAYGYCAREIVLVPTGVKAYMQNDWGSLPIWSFFSNPRKKGLMFSWRYWWGLLWKNPGNEGHIFAQMKNITKTKRLFLKLENVLSRLLLFCSFSNCRWRCGWWRSNWLIWTTGH